MNFISDPATIHRNFALMVAGTTGILGLDFSNPQTVNSLLGGGLAVVFAWAIHSIVNSFNKRSASNEVNEGKQLDIMQVLVVDIRESLDASTAALKDSTRAIDNNTTVVMSLKDTMEGRHREYDRRFSALEEKQGV